MRNEGGGAVNSGDDRASRVVGFMDLREEVDGGGAGTTENKVGCSGRKRRGGDEVLDGRGDKLMVKVGVVGKEW